MCCQVNESADIVLYHLADKAVIYFYLLIGVAVLVNSLVVHDYPVDKRLGIVIHHGRHVEFTHTPEARTHFLGGDIVFPRIDVCLFTCKSELSFAVIKRIV